MQSLSYEVTLTYPFLFVWQLCSFILGQVRLCMCLVLAALVPAVLVLLVVLGIVYASLVNLFPRFHR